MSMNSEEILDREFLEIRAKILEIAASFDRLERSDGTVGDDSRMQLIRQGIDILQSGGSDHAERIQQLFSRPYSPDWRDTFQLSK